MHGTIRMTIVRRSPGGRDKFGDPVPSTDAYSPLRIVVEGVAVAPRTGAPGTSSFETNDRARDVVVEGLTAFTPNVDLRVSDQVELDGYVDDNGVPILYNVEGKPGLWRSRVTGEIKGLEVALREATG